MIPVYSLSVLLPERHWDRKHSAFRDVNNEVHTNNEVPRYVMVHISCWIAFVRSEYYFGQPF
jgi:hypothetical protein